ncbi:MAG: hypothetical protein LBR25_00705 [Erysipelotrichaceae bacterium]|jgi:hypothetical protein|nr:hypothetical protein [Erysipelotrichaceae bacterium]
MNQQLEDTIKKDQEKYTKLQQVMIQQTKKRMHGASVFLNVFTVILIAIWGVVMFVFRSNENLLFFLGLFGVIIALVLWFTHHTFNKSRKHAQEIFDAMKD